TALRIADSRMPLGICGSIARSTVSMPRKTGFQIDFVLLPGHSFTYCGGMMNSSSMRIPLGLRACGFSAISTSNGAITVRDQYDTLFMWNGNHNGKCMISTGITGTEVQGSAPNSAS